MKSVRCDGVPTVISAEMLAFYERYGIELENSAAYHPKGNQLAEGAIHRYCFSYVNKLKQHMEKIRWYEEMPDTRSSLEVNQQQTPQSPRWRTHPQ